MMVVISFGGEEMGATAGKENVIPDCNNNTNNNMMCVTCSLLDWLFRGFGLY